MHQPVPARALVVVARPTSAPLMAPADALSRVTRLALGIAGLAAEALQARLERCVPADTSVAGAGGPRSPRILQQLPGIAISFGLQAQRRSLRTAAVLRTCLRPAHGIASHAALHGPLAAVWRRLDLEGWATRGLAEQRRNRLAAAAFLRELVSALTAAVLEQVDLDAVVARVDLDRIVDRLDLDAIVARVDVDAILRRVDLAGLAEQVISELDVGQIVRESGSTMTNETVDALRVQGMRTDRLLGNVVDRLLRRTDDRQTTLGQPPADRSTGGAAG